MEYKIFHKIRQKIKIPYILRIIFWVILIIFWIIMSIIPPVPWFVFVVIWFLFLIPVNQIKNIIKIRKWIVYLFKNLHCTTTIKRKFFDFFTHWKKIFSIKKNFFKNLKNFLVNLLILLITIWIFLYWVEKYFEYKIKSEISSNSAVNLPIFKKSKYRSWDMKPWSEAFQWFWNPTPKISINSDWLRDYEVPKKKTKNRILLLWDSFIFWMWWYQNQTISAFLNKKYFWEKYTRVINGWVIGQTIDDAFLYLKNDWIKFKPDFVVYSFFVWNDITELRRHKQTEDKNWNLIKTEDLKHFISDENFLRKRWKNWEIENNEPKSYFLFWFNENFWEKKENPTLTWPVFFADDDKRWDANLYIYWWKFFKYLKEMQKYCDENWIIFYVNIIPMDVQVSEKYWKKYPNMPFWKEEFLAERPQKRVIDLMEKEGINYINLLPLFQELDKAWVNLFFEKDPHFNNLWNMRAANAIYLKLIKDM